MLQIVTPLDTLPFVLLALAEPAEPAEPAGDAEPAGGTEEDSEAPSPSGPTSDWRYAITGGDLDGMYTVQVFHADDMPRSRGRSGASGRRTAVKTP